MKYSHFFGILLPFLLGVILLFPSCEKEESKKIEEPDITATISSFYFSGEISKYKFTIDSKNSVILNYDSISYNADLSNIVAVFTTKGENLKVEVNGKVQESGVTINDFTKPVVYDLFSGNEKIKSYTVKVNKKVATNNLTSFGFNEKQMASYLFTINSTANEIICKQDVLYGTDVSNLKAFFTTEENDAIVLIDGVKQESNVTTNDFRSPIVYTVRGANGTEKEYTVKMNVDEYYKYSNPVVKTDVPDPTVIKVGDYFYLYGTGYITTVFKSKNLIDWEYLGEAFKPEDRPNFEPNAGMWAPDINYINGQYVLYYAMSVWGGQQTCGIGVAVSDKPEGPFKTVSDGGKMFRSNEIGVQNSIDACIIEDQGKKYMFWGSFNGIYATEITDDGLRVKDMTKKTRIAGNHFEAAYVHKRGNYFYLFASIGSCCEGDNSTYTTVVGRSENVLGPYVNKSGEDMMYDNYEELIRGDGVKFVGPGHNSRIIQDDAGVDWMLYHAYIKGESAKGRVLAIDKVKWSDDGWPSVSNGRPSKSEYAPFFNN